VPDSRDIFAKKIYFDTYLCCLKTFKGHYVQ